MSSKRKLVSNIVIILFSAWILGGTYLKPIPAMASSTKDIHGSREAEALAGETSIPLRGTKEHENPPPLNPPSYLPPQGGEKLGRGSIVTLPPGEGRERRIPNIPSSLMGEGQGGDDKEGFPDETHRKKESHESEEHGDEVAHGAGGHGEKSWWRFSGWKIVFAGIASFYFVLVLAWLPLLVAKKSKGGVH